jgi:23S rRNA (guanosine2251-2'-O)-methyltransferase
MRKLANKELNRISVDEFKTSSKTPVIIVLDNVRSLNNVGSVFRTADAFLIEAVYLCGITGQPPNKEIQKTALGATESVNWKYFGNTIAAIEELKKEGYLVYSIEQAESAIMLNNFIPSRKQKIAIVFGNEVKGVQQEVIDASTDVIEIPQVGTKHSLNIAVSVGIVMWDLYLKIK